MVEGEPKAIETFMGKAELDFAGSEKHAGGVNSGGLTLIEAIVPENARIAGRTARGLKLLYRHSVTLLGVSRSGKRFRDRVRLLTIRPGDVLLLLGTPERTAEAVSWLGVLPLEGRETPVVQRSKAGLSIGIFLAALGAAVLGWTALSVSLAAAVIGFVAVGLVSGREVYDSIEWKVIVLLASLIPLAEAFERSGGAELIAGQLLTLTQGYPAWISLLVLMVVTMTLSDFLNNVATTLIAAPIAIGMATATGTNPDAWLMAVAVAASCAFLTPIGHKNNTLILGPGGYQFGEDWRRGLPARPQLVHQQTLGRDRGLDLGHMGLEIGNRALARVQPVGKEDLDHFLYHPHGCGLGRHLGFAEYLDRFRIGLVPTLGIANRQDHLRIRVIFGRFAPQMRARPSNNWSRSSGAPLQKYACHGLPISGLSRISCM